MMRASFSKVSVALAIAALGASVVATSVPAGADPQQLQARPGSVNGRQHRQHERIQQGVRSGELTHGEATRIRRHEAKIRREERRFRADGQLSDVERAKLQRDQNHLNQMIYHEKHDGQKRP